MPAHPKNPRGDLMDVEALSFIPPWEWPEEAGETLLRALRDDKATDPEQRLLAAEMASALMVMNDEIARTLLASLRDPAESEEMRGTAAIALGPTLEQLYLEIDDFEDDEERPVSPEVATAIQNTLREVYLDAEVPRDVRRRALEASIRYPADWHANAVRAAYYSGDPWWKLTAVFAMAHIKGFETEILEVLESGEGELRYHAIRAAGNWEIRAAWPHVRSILVADDPDKRLLLAAIGALSTLRPRQAAEFLHEWIDSEDEEIADAASESLTIVEGLAAYRDRKEW
jgi:hypothetical protein